MKRILFIILISFMFMGTVNATYSLPHEYKFVQVLPIEKQKPICPHCRKPLRKIGKYLVCFTCKQIHRVKESIRAFLRPELMPDRLPTSK